MANVKFFNGESIPLEMHKVRIVQKLNLLPVEERVKCIAEAGNNTFLLKNKDVFLDMLTDSGVNAMSDRQQAAMLVADDSYAGSATFTKLENKVNEIFGTKYFLPAHQGRACENILAMTFVKAGDVVPMNFHFTTPKAHITRLGGRVEELLIDEGLNLVSDHPFKGNFDLNKLEKCILENKGKIPFIRMEAGTNLIGGQPFELANAKAVCGLAKKYGIMTVLDASLWQDNLYFIKTREEACKNMSLREITLEVAKGFDIIYFSGRKLGFARGGGICMRDKELCEKMKELVQEAHVLLPNLTELCLLCDQEYPEQMPDDAFLLDCCRQLEAKGPSQIVVTGMEQDGRMCTWVYEKGSVQKVWNRKIGNGRPGSGDVFAAVVSGSLLRGDSLVDSVQRAADFVGDSMELTLQMKTPHAYGLCFEPLLHRLMD